MKRAALCVYGQVAIKGNRIITPEEMFIRNEDIYL